MAKLAATPKNLTEAIAALKGRSVRVIGNNTKLEVRDTADSRYVVATLHDHEIVRYTLEGVFASWAGYATSTTRDRLNQLTPARFNISKFEPQINGETLTGSWSEWHQVA